MKITFLSPGPNLSGGQRIIAIYAQKFIERGHEVEIVCTPWTKPPLRRKIKNAILGRKQTTAKQDPNNSHYALMNVPFRFSASPFSIVDAEVKDGDVVIASWWTTVKMVAELDPSKGAKAHFIQHDERVIAGAINPDDIKRIEEEWRWPIHRITSTQWLVDICEEFGDHKTDLVPYSVDLEMFHAPPRGRYEQPTVGLLWSPVEFKGCKVSFAALELVVKQIPNLKIIMFGESEPQPGDVPDSIQDNVEMHYRPAQNTIRELYERCDVWVCGSISEGFGMTIIEAMACRCPAVSTKSGGPEDFVHHDQNGYLVEVNDHEAIARHVIDLLTGPESEWQRLSDGAYQQATGYTWEDATDKMFASLENAIERDKVGELMRSPASV